MNGVPPTAFLSFLLLSSSAAAGAIDPLAARLPLRSERLSPGPVASRPVGHPRLTRPLCIIGDDPRSIAWLQRNAEQLRGAGSVCFLTAVENVDGLRRVQRAAAGTTVVTAPADRLAERYGIAHYPILISKEWTEQ